MSKFLKIDSLGQYNFWGFDEAQAIPDDICDVLPGYECFMAGSYGRYENFASLMYFV